MKPLPLVPLAFIALLGAGAPACLVAQDDKGKIDDVERSADDAKKHGSDDSGEGGWFVGLFGDPLDAMGHIFFGVVPADTGQGYQRFPYASRDDGFVRRRVTDGRRFGTVSASYFNDDQSTLRAWHFSAAWAGGMLLRELEFSAYAEPKATETDHLQMFRLAFLAVPPLGDAGYLKLGAGLQLVTVGSDAASGPEFELGAQVFPLRPFGLGATARVAPLTWAGGPEFGVGFVDVQGNASIFVGRFELQAGYRWTRIGVGAPFRGPTLGMRVWF